MPAYYNDIDAYCCKVLRKNIQQGYLPEGTVDERDIKQLHATDFVGCAHVHLFCGIGGFPLGLQRARFPQSIRVLTGGFPCQDISNAGQRAGITGERSGLWKEMYRLIQEAIAGGVAFDYILVENVSALVNRGLSVVLGDLAEAGYDAEWFCVRASDVGAPHQRERVFIVAYTNSLRETRQGSTVTNRQCGEIESAGVCQWENTTQMAHLSRIRGNTRRSQSKKQRRAPDFDRTGSSQLAYSTGEGLPQRGTNSLSSNATQIAAGVESQLERYSTMEHTSSSGQQEQHSPSLTACEGYVARRSDQAGITGTTQPLLGRVFDGLSRGMDRYRWPAGPGEPQHDWEPARVVTGKSSHRVARLKALGNAIVPQNIEEIARAILERETA